MPGRPCLSVEEARHFREVQVKAKVSLSRGGGVGRAAYHPTPAPLATPTTDHTPSSKSSCAPYYPLARSQPSPFCNLCCAPLVGLWPVSCPRLYKMGVGGGEPDPNI